MGAYLQVSFPAPSRLLVPLHSTTVAPSKTLQVVTWTYLSPGISMILAQPSPFCVVGSHFQQQYVALMGANR